MPNRASKTIPYLANSAEYFDRIRSAGHVVWLDSGTTPHPGRRYDVLAAGPTGHVLLNHAGLTALGDIPAPEANEDLFTYLARCSPECPSPTPDAPFGSGWIGYIGYDAGLPQHGINPEPGHPLALMARYRWAIVQDHILQRSWLSAETAELLTEAERLLAGPAVSRNTFQLTEAFTPSTDQSDYQRSFNRLKEYILSGDCYQANLARHWMAPCKGDALTAYLALRQKFAGPYSAFLDYPDLQILCLSPERFLQSGDGRVQSKPIKGTRPRGANPEEDDRLRSDLQQNPKDRAENLMIVDLLRNDLGKVCSPGSVSVPELFGIESFANVHHLVSTVEGELQVGVHPIMALGASFPGGSITGAPKRRAMEIIQSLEPVSRSVYCGSIGYMNEAGDIDMNIAIRTLVCAKGEMHCWGGGGIVADSTCESEFQETEHKVGGMMRLLEGLAQAGDQ